MLVTIPLADTRGNWAANVRSARSVVSAARRATFAYRRRSVAAILRSLSSHFVVAIVAWKFRLSMVSLLLFALAVSTLEPA